jgi:hypothetical protein
MLPGSLPCKVIIDVSTTFITQAIVAISRAIVVMETMLCHFNY